MIKVNSKELIVHSLAAIFGISSWIAINGIWSQTPLLVNELPESWKLSCYLVIIVQVANIGPLFHYLCTLVFTIKRIERFFIHSIMLIGCIASTLLVFFWNTITQINGRKYSVAFLCLSGVLALVDCTSSVLYMPFMSAFRRQYLVSHIVGEGLSGLLPSVFALIQGIGGNPQCVKSGNETIAKYPEPRFSVNTFFIISLLMILFSWSAFILLNKLPICRTEWRDQVKDLIGTADNSIESSRSSSDATVESGYRCLPMTPIMLYSLLITQAYICCLSNGIIPSIQSYSCLPYGNQAYHLSVTLSGIASPLASSTIFFISRRTIRRVLPICLLMGTMSAIYIAFTAVGSPHPWLQHQTVGQCLIVIVWILFSSSFALAKTAIATELRETENKRKSLLYNGIFTQIGSCAGAVVALVLLEYTQIFVSYFPCN